METSVILLFLLANLIVALLLRFSSNKMFAGRVNKWELPLHALVLLGMPNMGLFWIA